MKKMLLPLALFLYVAVLSFPDIKALNFEPKEFADDTYVIRFSSTEMERLDPKPLGSQSYDYAFKHKQKGYEIRYILFSQTENISDFGEYKVQAAVWGMMVINNILGDEEKAQNTSAFNEEDVKKEFNADFGFTNFAVDAQTDYTDGYKYIMINFFCKKDLGIMCHTILFNDIAWVETEDFLRWFHGFNFY